MNKFENVTVEDDTAIIISEDWKHGNIDCLFQVWIWDNIKGESLIFVADEVNDISDEELCDNPQIKDADQVTISRDRDGYTFVNFNFEARD
ncbi:MAG: hypothetical protein O3B12_06760 [Proteobacteria bacterium]|nr:hypothetical protein [Pseudomonadota bacterium]